MKVRRAVIMAAATNQRTIPLQTVFDHDGRQEPVINITLRETPAVGSGLPPPPLLLPQQSRHLFNGR